MIDTLGTLGAASGGLVAVAGAVVGFRRTVRLLARLDRALSLVIEAFAPSDPDVEPLPAVVRNIGHRLDTVETTLAELGKS